jgi:hypothetical protein
MTSAPAEPTTGTYTTVAHPTMRLSSAGVVVEV